MFTFMTSVTIFVAVIVGGLASVEGSIMGAAFIILVPQFLASYKEMVPGNYFGVTILIILIFEPLGSRREMDENEAIFTQLAISLILSLKSQLVNS